MTFRSSLKQALSPVIGHERIAALGRAEFTVRRKVARALDSTLVPGPAKPTAKNAAGSRSGSKAGTGVDNGTSAAAPPSDAGEHDSAAPLYAAPQLTRHRFLAELHRILEPRTYLEIGVNDGRSLTLSRTRSIGVDPAFKVTSEIDCAVQLVRETSDDFFARENPLEHFDGDPIDLAFIDGMHLAEFAYRDFANVEKLMDAAGVIVLDDMLPRSVPEAARDRITRDWAGDVYKVLLVLTERRPDLVVIPVNTSPTGVVLVTALDPASTVLADAYDELLPTLQSADPQQVPDDILRRRITVPANSVLRSTALPRLVALRESGADRPAVLKATAGLKRLKRLG